MMARSFTGSSTSMIRVATLPAPGRVGPGYTITDEFVEGALEPPGHDRYANTAARTPAAASSSSTWWITPTSTGRPQTPSAHPVFGEVVEGMDDVDRIGKVKTNAADKPRVPVKIEKAEVRG